MFGRWTSRRTDFVSDWLRALSNSCDVQGTFLRRICLPSSFNEPEPKTAEDRKSKENRLASKCENNDAEQGEEGKRT